MKAKWLPIFGLIALLLACKDAKSVVLVNVALDSDVAPIYSLRVSMSIDQAHDTKIYPDKASTLAIPSTTSLVIVLPRSRAGMLDLAFDGLDSIGNSVAHGTTSTPVTVGGTATVSVTLHMGASVCGNQIVDPGETCDDGNQFSFDGCDFRCMAESHPSDSGVSDTRPSIPGDVDGSANTSRDVMADTAVSAPDLTPDRPREPDGNRLDGRPEDVPQQQDAAASVRDSSSGFALGQTCTGKEQCASGNCVDGVCCQSTCNSVCMVCNLPTSTGQCAFARAGDDPRDNCSPEPESTCGRDGTCDGAGSCRRWVDGTVCGPATCTKGTAASERTCDGQGLCRAPITTRDCQPFACKGNACGTTCATPDDCSSDASCQAGVCKAKQALGTSCTSGSQCQSTHCTDGVCCESENCNSPSNSCSTCSNSTNGVPNGRCGARCRVCNCTNGVCSC